MRDTIAILETQVLWCGAVVFLRRPLKATLLSVFFRVFTQTRTHDEMFARHFVLLYLIDDTEHDVVHRITILQITAQCFKGFLLNTLGDS